jgi:hypothetical protein
LTVDAAFYRAAQSFLKDEHMTERPPKRRLCDGKIRRKSSLRQTLPVYPEEGLDVPPDFWASDQEKESFNNLKSNIHALYPEGISEAECDAATRNFINFGKLLLEIKRREGQD